MQKDKAQLEAALTAAQERGDQEQVAILKDKLKELAKRYETEAVIGSLLATL